MASPEPRPGPSEPPLRNEVVTPSLRANHEGASAPDDRIDLVQLGSTLRDHWRTIAAVTVAVFGVVMAATLMSRMEFSASGSLYLGEIEAKPKGGGEFDLAGSGQSDVGSEIEILKSRSLIGRAVLKSGLNASLSPSGWTAPRFWKWLLARRDTALLDAASKELRVVDASYEEPTRGVRALKVRFRSPAEYELRTAEGALLGHGKLGEPFRGKDLTLTLIEGARRGPSAGGSYDLTLFPLDEVIDGALAMLNVAGTKSTSGEPVKVLGLEFRHGSPFLSATFLSQLMRAYREERQEWKTEDASAAEAFVTEQLKSLREELDRTEKKLAEYRSNTRVVVLDNEAKAMIEQIGKYEEQRLAARLQVAAFGDMKRALKNPNVRLEAYMLGEANDSVLADLASSLSKARQELTDLEQRFHAAAPDVQAQRAQVNAQLATISNYVESRLSRAQENLGSLNGIIAQFENKLKTVPGAELGLAQLTRESDVYRRMYSYLLERQQQAGIVKASTVSKNRVLDEPRIPYRETAPRLGLRMASGLVGLLLGILVVLLRRFLSSSLQSEAEVRALAGSRPIFASLPRVSDGGVKASDGQVAAPVHVLSIEPRSILAEAFRTLRTNLYLASASSRGTVVLLTSPAPGDGKTTTTLSLAAMLAADGKQVLVLDADLRKPTHHEILQHDAEGPGLRSVLSGQCSWRDAVQPVSFSLGEFYSLGAGKLGPAELLSGDRMVRLIEETRTRFDYVLIDSASFPLVVDALVLGRLADCVLSVVRVGHSLRPVAHEHVRTLSAACRAYGVVVNGVKPSRIYGYGYQYGVAPPVGRFERPLRVIRNVSQYLPLGKKKL